MPNNEFHTNHSLGQDDQTQDQAHFFPQGRGEALVRPGQEHFIAATDETGLGAVDAVADDSAPTSMWGEAWRDLRRRPLFWVSAVLIILALLLAAVPQLFTSTDPQFCVLANSLDGPQSGHPFGFDRQGCDIFARTVYGARASVAVGVLTTLLVALIGTVFGALAGFFGGIMDTILSRITDMFFAIPLVLAAIVVMQMFKEHRTIVTVVLVLGLCHLRTCAWCIKSQDTAVSHHAKRRSTHHCVCNCGTGNIHRGRGDALLPGHWPSTINCLLGC